ncbi:MAG: hypothetical protein ASQ68_gp23 [Yellowstone Lake virophage 6]|uniref:hypothetical protein n=1 Tax=Yellowstone Lake virophage 6 TaxID=1557034 RepID=UPI000535EBE1|nr:MAG: hypothetical protein ASQ68_gp23 [Yellowstone Lake virophage 6]AIW01913.1 MAG: hypothetical protein YSLV6_ORF23 [Yellowstone Lake virophage 6]
MSAVRGYDNLYNEHVNDIALMNYNKGIANRLRMQEQAMQSKLPFKEPQLLSGGVRASNSIVAGTTAEPPSTLAVGGRAFRTFTGKETPSQGGVNRLKKAKNGPHTQKIPWAMHLTSQKWRVWVLKVEWFIVKIYKKH